jgi:hypothetical protein
MVRTKKKKITKKRIMRGGSRRMRSNNSNWRSNKSSPVFNLTLQKDKCDIPKDKKLFECYGKEVYECNNQAIGIVYNREKYEFYTITPLILSVSTMQLAANTGSISIIEENGNYYIGFINNFPSLRIEEDFNYAYKTRPLENLDNKKTKISNKSNRNSRKSSSQHINQSSTQSIHDTKQEAQWFNVYEDEDTLNDLKFQLIENYHACEKNVLEYDSVFHSNLDSIIREKYYKKDKNGHTIEPIYISTCTNLETYEYLTKKVRELIDIIENKTESQPEEQQQLEEPSNSTLKLKDLEIILHKFLSNEELSIAELNKLSIEQLLLIRKIAISKVIYRANVKFEDGTKEYITENIRWVCSNALWVEKYLELRNPVNLLSNKTLQSKEYECDLSGLDDKFVILVDFVIPGSEGEVDENYVIVGYPDKNMREHILNFWQLKTDNSNKKLYDSFNGLDKNLLKEIADLYDLYKKDEKDKINYTKDNPNNLYKLYMNLRKSIFKYIEDRYTELNKEDKTKVSDEELQNFKDNFETNAEAYFQHIALKYLPKPMVFIKYVFLIFKKQPDGRLTPMVFNVKELKPTHQPILKEMERLIKHELPYRFGILSDNEYNNGKGNEKDPFDDEYKLFYSRYRYGKFFHITTEYVHTMSNISDKAHGYKNSITLEELIYSCGLHSDLGNPFFENVKLEYEIREYQINNYVIVQSQLKTFIEGNNKNTKNRSDIVFDLYKEEKNKEEHKKDFKIVLRNKEVYNNSNTNLKNKDIKFILMFKSSVQEYTFIYSLDGLFYKLVIESNMKSIINDIIIELDTMVLSNKSNTIKFKKPIKLFRVISNDILNDTNYRYCFGANPLILKKIYLPVKTNMDINIDEFISTSLLDFKKLNLPKVIMKNLYNDKIHIPVLITNFLEYMKINSNICNINNVTYETKYQGCSLILCVNPYINCIHYDKHGYDIIETIDNHDNKIVLYIIPHNYTSKTQTQTHKYLGNFVDLDETSLDILEKIKEIYDNSRHIIFLHTAYNPRFNCLHFHIVKKENYKREYSANEKGSFIIQDIFIDTLINNIKTNNKYYNNLDINFDLIRTY